MSSEAVPVGGAIARRLEELDISLPVAIPPVAAGNYARAVCSGNLLFVSGHLPDSAGDPMYVGKLGRDVTTAQGYDASRQAALNLLATVRDAAGGLDRVQRVVKLLGMVNCIESYTEQSKVIDGASDVLCQVLGDAAVHARSAVGMAQLPRNNCVELEAIVELTDTTGLPP